MKRSSFPHPHRRRGQVAVLVAVSLTVLLGAAAFALDGGLLLAERRHAQAAADAAALAGAIELFKIYPEKQGEDTAGDGGIAQKAAEDVAKANYTKANYTDLDNLDVTVNIPPESSVTPKPDGTLGLFNGRDSFVEVILTYRQKRGFSAIWGSDRIHVGARAIARGSWAKPRGGVVLLHPTDPGALTVGGQGNTYVNVLGGEVVVNSSASNAITINGGNAIVAAQGYYIKGSPGVDNSGSLKEPNGTTTSSHVYPNSPRQPDPFRHIPEPSLTTVPQIRPDAFVSRTATEIKKLQGQEVTAAWTAIAQPRIDALVAAGKLTAPEGATSFDSLYLLVPGKYGSLKFPNASTLVLFQQATDGGIFNLSQGMTANGASLMMDPGSTGGIMLYHTGDGSKASDSLSFSGGAGKVWLSPPTSGMYKNMMIFVSRNAPAPLVSVSGGAQFDIGGSIYSQQGELSLGGSAVGNKIGSQHVSSTMKVAGGANVTVTYNSGLVANERIITLVE